MPKALITRNVAWALKYQTPLCGGGLDAPLPTATPLFSAPRDCLHERVHVSVHDWKSVLTYLYNIRKDLLTHAFT